VVSLNLLTGGFNVTGVAQELKYFSKLNISPLLYNITINPATLVVTRFLSLDTGSFTYSGNSILFTRHYECQFFAPSYHSVFNSLTISKHRALQLTGNFIATASNLDLHGTKKLGLSGEFNISSTVDLKYDRKSTLETGSFTNTTSQILLQNFDLAVVETGSFGYTGSAVNLAFGRKINVQSDFYFVGFDQSLNWSGSIVYPQDNPWTIVVSDELYKLPLGNDDHAIIVSGGDYEVIHN